MFSFLLLGFFALPLSIYIWLIFRKKIRPNPVESLLGGILIGFFGPIGLLLIILAVRESQNSQRDFFPFVVDLFEDDQKWR